MNESKMRDDDELAEKPTLKEKAAAAGEKTVSAAKRNKGMLVGAAVGTAIVPVLGTVIGGAIGSLWD